MVRENADLIKAAPEIVAAFKVALEQTLQGKGGVLVYQPKPDPFEDPELAHVPALARLNEKLAGITRAGESRRSMMGENAGLAAQRDAAVQLLYLLADGKIDPADARAVAAQIGSGGRTDVPAPQEAVTEVDPSRSGGASSICAVLVGTPFGPQRCREPRPCAKPGHEDQQASVAQDTGKKP